MIPSKIQSIIICAAFTVLSFGFMAFIDSIIRPYLGDFSASPLHNHLAISFSEVDRMMIRWHPLAIAFLLTFKKNLVAISIIRLMLAILVSLSLGLVLGWLVAIFTWPLPTGTSPLLPSYTYIKYQPFTFYWTIFISAGILLPVIIYRWKRTRNNSDLLDDKNID
jgi:hypothetical protein